MVWYFLVALVAVLIFFIVVGAVITRRATGVLIDTRNKVSLSQFQLVLWSWILLSGFITIALARIFVGAEDPLGFAWDERLWGLLGISIGSATASMAIKNVKKGKEPTAAAFAALGNRQGLLVTNPLPGAASVWDMFRGEEPANYNLPDIGKVQMFLFTIVSALAYAFALSRLIANTEPEGITSMPVLSEGLVFILGISHAGYLGSKWADKQPST